MSFTLVTVLPAGRVVPTCSVQESEDLTVVVQVLPVWAAVTLIESVPTRILDPDTVDCPGGTSGSTSWTIIAKLWIDPELLMHNGPQHTIGTPGLLER